MVTYALPVGFTDSDMVAFGFAFLIEGVPGFILNAISIVSFLAVKEMQTPSNLFIFNLAVADISLNVNGIIAGYASFMRHWPFGSGGCQKHAFQGMVSVLASISFIGAIAWDRYHQYCTKQKFFWSSAMTMSGIVWVLSFFWAVLPLVGWGEYDFEPLGTCCTLDYSKGDWNYISYMLTLTFLYLIIPALTMLSSYQSINKQFKKTRQYKLNTAWPLRVMLLCWGPYVLLCMYASIYDVSDVSPRFRMMLPVLAKSSPFFHSLLYAFGSENYLAGIRQLFTGKKMALPEPEKSK
ncbi:hypothetical protein GJAV_G00148200 [Gymnothorax javanicus]|nr:hypothetical protein GJAV_G00148200 [Gymnothorax javanicus]